MVPGCVKSGVVDPTRKTPAERLCDNVDYMPTKPAVLMGHHFSSIAGAGPIVGPITAAVFGWVPVIAVDFNRQHLLRRRT